MSEPYSIAEIILENFPHPTIAPIMGQPNYETLAEVYLKLNTNSASIHENRGHTLLGLLFLTVKPQVHATTLIGAPFIPPINPVQHPNIPPETSGTAIAELRCMHQASVDEFKLCQNTDKALNTN